MSKQHILENAKQNGFVYPNLKVFLGFLLLGGATGGFFLGFYHTILNFLQAPNKDIIFILNTFAQSLIIALIFSLLGILFEAIPAFLTSFYLTATNFIIVKKFDYIKLFLLGFISTFLVYCFVLIFAENLINNILFYSLGGISSMICGKLFLPKLSDLPKDFNQKN